MTISLLLFAPAFGVLLHEVLRLYNGVWNEAALAPLKRPVIYAILVITIATLFIILAEVFSVEDMVGRIAFGFAFTTLPAMLKPGHRRDSTDDQSDVDSGVRQSDIRDEKESVRWRAPAWEQLSNYFYWY